MVYLARNNLGDWLCWILRGDPRATHGGGAVRWRWYRRKAQALRPLPKVPWRARSRIPTIVVLFVGMILIFFPLSAALEGWFARLNPPFSAWGTPVALGLILLLGPSWFLINERARVREYFNALSPLPLSMFFRGIFAFWIGQRWPHKTFFVRNGRVVGDRERVERENLRPFQGVVIVDGVSAAVFRDQAQGGLFVAGPGVTFLHTTHWLVATLSLRPQVVVYGGNPWSQTPSPTAEEVVVELSGVPIAARLVGVFALLSPDDYPHPHWYGWLREQVKARNEQEQVCDEHDKARGEQGKLRHDDPLEDLSRAEARAYRDDFEAQTFLTAFHGHGWSARTFAEAVLTDVLDNAAQNTSQEAREPIPELLSGSVHWFQALLRDAWQEAIAEVQQADRLFEPVHPQTNLRWIDEVQRVFRERLTQPCYRPIHRSAGSAPKRQRSREYWLLRAVGLKAITAALLQVYFPPSYEAQRAEVMYEPLWVFLERLRGHGQHYHRLAIERDARYHTYMLHTEYMARRWTELVGKDKDVKEILRVGSAEDLARVLVSLTEGSEYWLRESARLEEHDPRQEHLRALREWLRLWWRSQRGGG